MAPARSGQNQQRSIIITGCSSGIGAYCAEALKSQGWRVFATARKDADIEALRAKGIETHYLDYTQPQSIANLVDEVLRQTDGTLDALFNNGAYAQPGAIEDLPVEALRQQFEANFFGWHDLTRRVIPVMRRQGHGRIVHCSSILGLVPMKWRGAYVASKFALEGLMLAQRMELEGSGIDVSLIEPGPIASRFTYNAASHAEANIDMEASVHRELYQRQMAKLKSGGTKSKNKLGPEAVYAVLLHALEAPRPRPHYVVTRPAKLGSLARRLMPARWLYRMLSDQS
ncbi:NAD(P)-dependent dehydrogenase (short-subunit alcohol dehydrogenase family) [Ochrobactrum intermedium]|uniref:NAD(P)-dependent dehydrogenase (Short-subunit alcohol dehydrogenase family) n=2 Tax=Brucella intermedia TaxID=94625 RepID=A0ABR6APK3_9HYPH|nr:MULTISPECIES: SDR family oxidoreductase [Brucella]ERI12813.1 short-chain dehydrogenase [Ochrobactrum sp. EGD-AQ16]KAB2713046.1 SDR family oxidoreductase [Brucella intermedia]MBA8851393.1 NAD(P)-dependent dehydrogenase (short-subunit alcohol dehydrogenase family) [Brucella intermedia]MCH6205938.1 SDR family oxidoreductase [Brucella ciceri]MDH0124607.1 SDR family oxidoreductase [Brucella intermedia GD04153]